MVEDFIMFITEQNEILRYFEEENQVDKIQELKNFLKEIIRLDRNLKNDNGVRISLTISECNKVLTKVGR